MISEGKKRLFNLKELFMNWIFSHQVCFTFYLVVFAILCFLMALMFFVMRKADTRFRAQIIKAVPWWFLSLLLAAVTGKFWPMFVPLIISCFCICNNSWIAGVEKIMKTPASE